MEHMIQMVDYSQSIQGSYLKIGNLSTKLSTQLESQIDIDNNSMRTVIAIMAIMGKN